MKSRFFCLLSLFLLMPLQARWATYEDAPVEYESFDQDITVEKDGKAVEIITYRLKILNEAGREQFGIQRLHYNDNVEKIEILEAKAIYDGKEYPVARDAIEIKPMASDTKGFDQLFQILISFPRVQVGSQLHLKYKITTTKQPLPNYYSRKFGQFHEGYFRKSHFDLKSKIPFHTLINDPREHLTIREGKDKSYQTLIIDLKEPLYEATTNEPPFSILDASLQTWVSVSTVDKYEELSKALAENYEKCVNQTLPAAFELIKREAESQTSTTNQINTITSLLSEKIRYMGDWRSIDGRFFPRSLEKIVDSSVGDCKDFASSLVAILRKLGYKANVALVMRGIPFLPHKKDLPSLECFNHAMVKIVTKEGDVLWIDPTNLVSMANGVFPDIANRPALVLDEQTPSYENIPDIDYKHAHATFENAIDLKDRTTLHAQGKVVFSGESALSISGAALSQSIQAIEESIIQKICGEKSPTQKSITLPDLKSRIVKDMQIDFSYEQENATLLTNVGTGIPLSAGWSELFLSTATDQQNTMFVGPPTAVTRKLVMSAQALHPEALRFNIETPWINVSRTCLANKKGIEITEQVEILRSFIFPDEVKSAEFKALQSNLKKYCRNVAVIVKEKRS